MDWKTFLYRLLVLIVVCVGGLVLIGVAYNIFIMAGIIPEGMDVRAAIEKTAYVFMGSIVASVASMAVKDKIFGKILLFTPLYAPSLFAFVNILIH